MKKRPLYILSLYVMFILAIFISPASPFGGAGVKYAYLHTKNSVHLESNYTFEIRIIFGMLFEYLVGNLSVSMRVFPLVCVSMYILPLVCIFTVGIRFSRLVCLLVCVFYIWYAFFTFGMRILPFVVVIYLSKAFFDFDKQFLPLIYIFYV